ncbi:Egf Domain-Specific O-Linked N-Acetylglucosamine Transferase [Manis pentadactyla]|nr:Egf Domain-Specific O-Linked N-Acetylglucosamine Transferase [Manis pentadactyla]
MKRTAAWNGLVSPVDPVTLPLWLSPSGPDGKQDPEGTEKKMQLREPSADPRGGHDSKEPHKVTGNHVLSHHKIRGGCDSLRTPGRLGRTGDSGSVQISLSSSRIKLKQVAVLCQPEEFSQNDLVPSDARTFLVRAEFPARALGF